MSTVNTVELKTVAPKAASQALNDKPTARLIDVRTPAEFREVHATQAENIPLDQIHRRTDLPADQPVYLICRSGTRAKEACRKLHELGLGDPHVVEGGTDAWIGADLPVIRGNKSIGLERQVLIAAGSLVLIGAVLAIVLDPVWIGLSAVIGAGLMYSGITDTCGMAMILAKMPWNRR